MADSTAPSVKPTSALARFAQTKPLILFFLLAYAWAWTFWLPMPWLAGRIANQSTSDVFEITLFIVGAFGPTVGALLTRWIGHRDLRICPLWTSWRPMILGLAVGLAGFFIATVVAPALSLVRAPLQGLHWSSLLHWSTFAVNYSTFLGGPVNEEPGWRGFALPRLQKRFGPYRATIILAPLWAAWHLPLFRVEGWNTASPWQFFLIVMGAAFLLTAAANLSKFSVLVAMLLHSFFNTSAGLVNALDHDLPPRPYPTTSYALAVLVCGVVLGAAILAKHGVVIEPPASSDS